MARVMYDFQAMARNELAVKKGDLVTIRKQINQQWMEVEDCSSGLVVCIDQSLEWENFNDDFLLFFYQRDLYHVRIWTLMKHHHRMALHVPNLISMPKLMLRFHLKRYGYFFNTYNNNLVLGIIFLILK